MEVINDCLNISLNDFIRIPDEIDVSSVTKIRIIKRAFPMEVDKVTLYPPRPIKPPYRIPDMINSLKKNYKVSFTDKENKLAKEFFLSTNYYKFCIYPKLIQSSCSFRDVMFLYNFDNTLREHMLILIPRIESFVKTSLAYHMSHSYNGLCEDLNIGTDNLPPGLVYLNRSIYQERDLKSGRIDDMMHDLATDMISRINQELTVHHHVRNFGGYMPIWALVEQMTFGKISTLITCIKRPIRKPWIDSYFANLDATPKNITSWIHSCVVLRNIAFHGGRLYGRTFTYSPSFGDTDHVFKNMSPESLEKIRPSLFTGLLVMKRIYSKLGHTDRKLWDKFIYILTKNINHPNHVIDIKQMGFPDNWKELLTIVNE